MAEETEIPEGLYYTPEHEWIKVEGDLVRIGISDYAQEQLGDVVFVELPPIGDKVERYEEGSSKEAELGAVESVKTVSDIYSPVMGSVEEVNEDLQAQPELINEDPYGQGWICVIRPSNLEEDLEELMDSKSYKEFLKSEG